MKNLLRCIDLALVMIAFTAIAILLIGYGESRAAGHCSALVERSIQNPQGDPS
ncbi:MAG: hypothetical protein ACREUF_15445 [Solimonas sp.]